MHKSGDLAGLTLEVNSQDLIESVTQTACRGLGLEFLRGDGTWSLCFNNRLLPPRSKVEDAQIKDGALLVMTYSAMNLPTDLTKLNSMRNFYERVMREAESNENLSVKQRQDFVDVARGRIAEIDQKLTSYMEMVDKMRSRTPVAKETESAVRYLMEKIDRGSLEHVWKKMQEDPDWWAPVHHDFGMGVRNLLREGGFTWDVFTLDGMWHTLIEEAARRTVSSTS